MCFMNILHADNNPVLFCSLAVFAFVFCFFLCSSLLLHFCRKLHARTSEEEIRDSFQRVNSLRSCECTYGSLGHVSDLTDGVKTVAVLWLPHWPYIHHRVHVSLPLYIYLYLLFTRPWHCRLLPYFCFPQRNLKWNETSRNTTCNFNETKLIKNEHATRD